MPDKYTELEKKASEIIPILSGLYLSDVEQVLSIVRQDLNSTYYIVGEPKKMDSPTSNRKT